MDILVVQMDLADALKAEGNLIKLAKELYDDGRFDTSEALSNVANDIANARIAAGK